MFLFGGWGDLKHDSPLPAPLFTQAPRSTEGLVAHLATSVAQALEGNGTNGAERRRGPRLGSEGGAASLPSQQEAHQCTSREEGKQRSSDGEFGSFLWAVLFTLQNKQTINTKQNKTNQCGVAS